MLHKNTKIRFVDFRMILEIIKDIAATITFAKYIYQILQFLWKIRREFYALPPQQGDILRVLSFRGPLKLTHIMYTANINCTVLGEHLYLLIKQGWVEERTIGRERVVYALTQKGNQVLLIPKIKRKIRRIAMLFQDSFFLSMYIRFRRMYIGFRRKYIRFRRKIRNVG